MELGYVEHKNMFFEAKFRFFRLKADVYLVNCVTNEINALS